MDLSNLQDQINKLGVDISALLEKESLTPDEELRFDAIDADRDRLMKQRDRIIKHDGIEKQLGESERRSEPTSPRRTDTRATNGNPAEDQVEAMRGWLYAGTDQQPTDEMRNAATRTGVNLDRRDLRLTLPRVSLRYGSNPVEELRSWEQRAQATAPDSAGGYTVPELLRSLEVGLLAFGGMRQAATIIRTDGGGPMRFPTVNDTSEKGVILAENTQVAQQDVTFDNLVLDAFKYSSKMILVSVELLQDNAVNLAAFLGEALATRLGRITNEHYSVGTGSSQPNGIVTASTLGKTGANGQTGSIIYDDFVDLEHSVDPAYRGNARWMFHDQTLAAIKRIKIPQFDTDTAGVPLWQPGLAVGSPDRILGYPYIINQDMPTMAASAKSVLFGDLSKYLIRDVREVVLLRLDERFADFHQVAFLAFYRGDGDLLNAGTNPVKHYANAAV